MDAARIRRETYNSPAAELRRQLSGLAAGLGAQLAELEHAPTLARCETLAINLDGARSLVLKLRAALSEGEGHAR